MSDARKKAILFASTPPWRAAKLFESVRTRWPDHDWTVCLKASEGEWVPAGYPTERLRAARPGLACLRRIRSTHFDLAVACWSGEGGYGRQKLMHMLATARESHAYNENLDSFGLDEAGPDPVWLRHVRYRLGPHHASARPSFALVIAGLYGRTLGPALGTMFVLARHGLWTLGLRPRALPPVRDSQVS